MSERDQAGRAGRVHCEAALPFPPLPVQLAQGLDPQHGVDLADGRTRGRIGRSRRVDVTANRHHEWDSKRAEEGRWRGNDNDLRLQSILRVAQ
jgi:hypothetical protein